MLRVLSDADVAALLDLQALLSVVADAFRAQGEARVERPERPHFPVGRGLDPDDPERPLGTGLAMPAYVHGQRHYATKLASIHEDEPETVKAQLALTDAATGAPVAYLDARRLTNARTGCIGGLAAREFARRPATIGVLGAGAQARWQARAIAAAIDVAEVRVHSPSGSRERCAADLRERGIDARVVDSPAAAVRDTDVVVTATTSREPVFPGDALGPGTVVVAVGAYTPEMRELDAETMARADRVFADVPEEAVETGDVLESGLDPDTVAPFADVLLERADRERADEVLVVLSVGSAVLDAATATHLYERAVERDVGELVAL